MNVFVQTAGLGLVCLALVDIYLTVLHPRADSSLLSVLIFKGIWRIFQCAACTLPVKKDKLFSYSGPTVVVVTIMIWVTLLLLGFALVIWAALGSAIQASEGQTPNDFMAALYYSGYSLTTLGTGDLVPQTNFYRLLTILEAALGFSIFTLTITYILSVYAALIKRNSFALSLHHRTDDTADAAELLARLTAYNDINNVKQDVANIAGNLIELLESQNSYPVLLYFRFRQMYYALPRVMYLTMDTAALIKSALDEETYGSMIHSTATAELWRGGLHLLSELSSTLLPKARSRAGTYYEQAWRTRYYRAIERLKEEGVVTTNDVEAGAETYIALRHQWAPYLLNLSSYMNYEWYEVAPHEY